MCWCGRSAHLDLTVFSTTCIDAIETAGRSNNEGGRHEGRVLVALLAGTKGTTRQNNKKYIHT